MSHLVFAASQARIEPGTSLRELDRRNNDGVDVRLLWDSEIDAVSIAVEDERSGESLSFDVDASDALVAFQHPYAYAAAKTLRSARRRSMWTGHTSEKESH